MHLRKSQLLCLNHLWFHSNVPTEFPKCKKYSHLIGGSIVLPVDIDTVEIVHGESYAKELRKSPLADNTVGKTASDVSDLCGQLIDHLKTSRFELQTDKTTDAV